ncbi:hypothetical protein F4775DRAFT_535605 [Biscogniauxia sp. FL1348]|nr:hypothetical protein F4775DRAFT_535605 [Biscogniauxia sp. FL1348]
MEARNFFFLSLRVLFVLVHSPPLLPPFDLLVSLLPPSPLPLPLFHRAYPVCKFLPTYPVFFVRRAGRKGEGEGKADDKQTRGVA